MKRILITGANGQVGWELCRTLSPLGTVIALDRAMLDIANPDAIRRQVREIQPDIIVNAAAYTAVDKAEADADMAAQINGTAPGVLAEEIHALGGSMVHYSTDYVFDGTKSTPYTEEDPTNPLSVYGRTKLAGEQAIAASGVPHLILRTSWVYGRRGHNFLLTMLRLAKQRESLSIVNDQIGAPSWCRMLAEATAQILVMGLASTKAKSAIRSEDVGVYHLTASGRASWYDFAQRIFAYAAIANVKVSPISSADYPQTARRPANSVLSNQKLQDHFGVVLPNWDVSLRQCMADRLDN
jgi:dTDP-4-dehydrorhamnose reductase